MLQNEDVLPAVYLLETVVSGSDTEPVRQCTTAFAVGPRLILTSANTFQGLESPDVTVTLMNGYGPNRLATPVSIDVQHHLAALVLAEDEPDAPAFLELAEKSRANYPALVRFFGYNLYPRTKEILCTNWPGMMLPSSFHCPCGEPDCPYLGEPGGWFQALMYMKKGLGWTGGPIIDFKTGEVLSLSTGDGERVKVRFPTKPIDEHRFQLIGTTLHSMKELIANCQTHLV